MNEIEETIAELGNEPPLLADGRAGPPDKREVSARWLSGTFLTGVTSSILMGVALLAALDGREQLATPPEIMKLTAAANEGESGEDAKTTRLSAPHQIARAKDRRRMDVPTVTRVGDRDVIRNMPFMQIKMALAAGHKTTRKYPAFDPFAVASEDGEPSQVATDIFFGAEAKAESDMSIKTIDFPMETAAYDEKSGLSADEVEEVVRSNGCRADRRCGASGRTSLYRSAAFRHLRCRADDQRPLRRQDRRAECLGRAACDGGRGHAAYAEDIIPFTEDRNIKDALAQAGYEGDDAVGMAEAISKMLNTDALKKGTVLRVGLVVHGDEPKVVRTSVYKGTDAHHNDRRRRPRSVRARRRTGSQSRVAHRLRRYTAAGAYTRRPAERL